MAGLVACTLAGVAPALAGDPARHPRDLHPVTSSGGEPGTIAQPVPPYLRRATTRTSQEVSWKVVPGVVYTRWTQTDVRGPIRAHLLTIRTRTPGLRIDYASIGAVRQAAPVRDILAVDRAVAGVNGDFYDIGHTGAPYGLGVDRQRGLLHGREQGWNTAFYLSRHGVPRIGELPMSAQIIGRPRIEITNLNSPFVAPGGIGVYNARWGRTAGRGLVQGQRRNIRAVQVRDGRVVRNSPVLPRADQTIKGLWLIGRGPGAARLRTLSKGSRVRLGYHLRGHPQMAISGNHFLINDGLVRPVDDRVLAPRTAVGIDSDTGEVLLLVVDGRSSRSRGYTMVELADLMVDLGADAAINLDGGGSSTMVGKGRGGTTKVLNSPSDGFERSVANAIEVTVRKRRP